LRFNKIQFLYQSYKMNKLLLVLVILLVVIYTRYNLKYNDYYQILQTSLDKFHEQLLYEKNPLVITDIVYNQEDLLQTIFKYQYITYQKWSYNPDMKTKYNYAKFLLLYSNDKTMIKIINPKYKNDDDPYSVLVKLNPKQTLVIPPRWLFSSETMLNCISIHDTFSIIHQTLTNIL
jgi:hypothetical protein